MLMWLAFLLYLLAEEKKMTLFGLNHMFLQDNPFFCVDETSLNKRDGEITDIDSMEGGRMLNEKEVDEAQLK